MDIALHFDADIIHAKYPDLFYNLPILDKLFRSLLMAGFNNLHLKIFEGDLLVDSYIYHQSEERIQKLLDGLLGIHFRTWRDIDKQKLRESIFSSRVYVLFLQNINGYVRDYLIRIFKAEMSYIGAIEILGVKIMVAHIVKTQKPVQIRATFLLFFAAPLCSHYSLLMPCENTLQQAFGNQVPDEGAPDYKT